MRRIIQHSARSVVVVLITAAAVILSLATSATAIEGGRDAHSIDADGWGTNKVEIYWQPHRNGPPEFLCTGGVIDKRVIVTSRHCYEWKENDGGVWRVVANNVRTGRGNWLGVTGWEFAPNNDVAVMHLDADVNITRDEMLHVNSYFQAPPSRGDALDLWGWGDDAAGVRPNGLRAITVQVGSNGRDTHDPLYGGAQVWFDYPAGGHACEGDSGGPLTVVRDGREQLFGLYSEEDQGACGPTGFAAMLAGDEPGQEREVMDWLRERGLQSWDHLVPQPVEPQLPAPSPPELGFPGYPLGGTPFQ